MGADTVVRAVWRSMRIEDWQVHVGKRAKTPRKIVSLLLASSLVAGCSGILPNISREGLPQETDAVASREFPTATQKESSSDEPRNDQPSAPLNRPQTPGTPIGASPISGDLPLGNLYWGTSPSSGLPWSAAELGRSLTSGRQDDAARQTRRVLQLAEETLNSEAPVVADIDREGKLPSDPRYKASDEAVRSVDRVYQWAMCGRVAAEPLASRCREKAERAIDAWAYTYRPSGNPINDMYLVPVIQATDLLLPIATPERQLTWTAWCSEFARAGDKFYMPLKPTNATTINNWASWRLLLRALGGRVGRETAVVKDTRALVSVHVERNLQPDGSSVDFEERDALHYHTYNLEALVLLALFVPETVDDASAARIEAGLQFMRPFVLGEQKHIEFVRSRVSFDIQRRDAGVAGFANVAWDPRESRNLLRQARTRFLSIRAWTDALVDEQYSPRIKQIAALRGG